MSTLAFAWISFAIAFGVALPPTLSNILAGEKVLNCSFKSGWSVALGATLGQGVYISLTALLFLYEGDLLFLPEILTSTEDFTKENRNAFIFLAALVLALFGMHYLRKTTQESDDKKTNLAAGFGLAVLGFDYLITHSFLLKQHLQEQLTIQQALIFIFVGLLGAHVCWLFKLIFMYYIKGHLIKRNWCNFNKITGWGFLSLSCFLLLWACSHP